jgi:hypothetical protein
MEILPKSKKLRAWVELDQTPVAVSQQFWSILSSQYVWALAKAVRGVRLSRFETSMAIRGANSVSYAD